MSEEILKALTQLFAIITKQDGGTTANEREYVIQYFRQQLNPDVVKEYITNYDKLAEYPPKPEEKEDEKDEGEEEDGKPKKKRRVKLTNVKDSVRTLAICKKINKTLQQKQKLIALMKLLELVAADRNFTPQRMSIIKTVSEVFNIKEGYTLIEKFATLDDIDQLLEHREILIVNNQETSSIENLEAKHICSNSLNGEVVFLSLPSEDMYFVKYVGNDDVYLNGFLMVPRQIYLFSHGSTIKLSKSGTPLYYSDIISHYREDSFSSNISFNVENLVYKFPNGAIGLHNINLSEEAGRLVAIMGSSGAGKTTLLNALAGIEYPASGSVRVNGIDLHRDPQKVKGLIGYVAQDDILFEDLTVYENLYYNAKLCFKDYSEEELNARVMKTLGELGLAHIKDLKVGNVLNKKISGGQRKRLNIALELIREPSVMFVDEPTSGLSSRDSENVMDLLKELTLKGKLIFVVIHQPSSDIFKMFDQLIILDTGGYLIFNGNPVEGVTYFKEVTNQIETGGQCGTCGNINPESIFNIIEARVVDEYGQFTDKRKVNPTQWQSLYRENFEFKSAEDINEDLPQSLDIPSRLTQFLVFTTRDLLSKISNAQYMLVNLLEAPLLGFLLAFIIRYNNDPAQQGEYIFRYNENIPAFIFIAVIVALFMGLTISAEEIIKDRKIQKREKFLNLSRHSYLLSKVTILFLLSGIQTITFVLIGNWILEIPAMTFTYWVVLFSISCFANMLGMNISATFDSAVTIYIMIPLLLIPQMILSGAIFSFEKLNDYISTKGKVPLIADIMVSRWGFEGIAVSHYKNNAYQQLVFDYEKAESVSNYLYAYLIPELQVRADVVKNNLTDQSTEAQLKVAKNLELLKNTIDQPMLRSHFEGLNQKDFEIANADTGLIRKLHEGLKKAEEHHIERFNKANELKETLLYKFDKDTTGPGLNELKNSHYNESLEELVKNAAVKDKFVPFNGRLIQQIDPVFNVPEPGANLFSYRTHFLAPQKYFAGRFWDTLYFNLSVIWFMSVGLYVTLYRESIRRFLGLSGKIFSKIAMWYNRTKPDQKVLTLINKIKIPKPKWLAIILSKVKKK